MRTDKAVATGTDLLVPKAQWCDVRELQGDDPDVLFHPRIEQAFAGILALHKPKHRIALLSLCTSTRPYSTGRKWKTLKEKFGSTCDLIVTSNGGIIPLEFEQCWPYMNYDAHGKPQYDEQYVSVMSRRLISFFERHHYEHAVFVYRPQLRNCRAVERVRPRLHKLGIKDVVLLPSQEHYRAFQQSSAGYLMFPELHPACLGPVEAKVRELAAQKSSREKQEAKGNG